MAPENSQQQAASSNGANIAIPTPSAGQVLSVPSSPGGNLVFSFDPVEAEFSRQDNAVSIKVNGGEVVLEDFFVVGENALPTFTLPDGTVVDPTDIFADMDLATAAGPAFSGAENSGLNAYADDPGALLGGVDRLGSLGTMYWDRNTEVPENYTGVAERPGGLFSFDISSGIGGVFFAGLYEDGQANKHADDTTTVYGQLSFTPQLSGSTVIDAIHLSGFDKDTVIYFGNPENGAPLRTVVVADPSQIITFSEADFVQGVYMMPPKHSDSDMNISFTVDMHAASSGISGSANGSFTIIVDAVADKPELKIAEFDGSNLSGQIHVSEEENKEYFTNKNDEGWHTIDHTFTGKENFTVSIPFSATITFSDYVLGHEQHYALIEIPKNDDGTISHGEWSCKYNGGTYAYTVNAEGVIEGDVIEHDGHLYFKIPVSNGDIEAAGGTITLDVTLTVSGTTESLGVEGEDNAIGLKVGAMAEEHPDDDELRWDNNVAFDISEGTVSLDLDVINSGLSVNAGWASEGNADGKHTDSAYTTTVQEAGATGTDGAPIKIELGTSQGNAEYITEVTLGHTSDEGSLVYSTGGNDYVLSVEALASLPANVSYNPENGTFTIRFSAADNVTGLSGDGSTHAVHYRPNEGSYADNDIPVHYTVTVENGKGTIAVYEGHVIVVVDAVADLPMDVTSTVGLYDNNEGYSAAGWESTVQVTVKGQFFDLEDGSESHYLLLEAREGWGNGAEYPTVQLAPDGPEYFYVDITNAGVISDGNGNYSFTFEVTTPAEDSGYPDVARIAKDESISLKSGALAVEGAIDATGDTPHTIKLIEGNAADHDTAYASGYDYGNNVAFAPSEAVAMIDFNVINAVTSGTTIGAYEDHKPDQHLHGEFLTTSLAGDGRITLSLHDGINEHITGGSFSYTFPGYKEGMDLGSFTIDGVGYTVIEHCTITPNKDGSAHIEFNLSSLPSGTLGAGVTGLDMFYNPPRNDDTDLTNFTFSLNVQADTSKATSVLNGTVIMEGNTDAPAGTIIVDAVADKPDAIELGNALYADGSMINDKNNEKTAATPSESIKIVMDSVQFHDYEDGSEQHFLVLYTGATIQYDSGKPVVLNMAMTKGQDITIQGDDYTQVIEVGSKVSECSLALKDSDGTVLIKVDHTGKVTELGSSNLFEGLAVGESLPGLSVNWAQQMLTSQNIGDGKNGFQIPVLNELLQQSDGMVSATFDANVQDPDKVTGDGTIKVNVAATAKENASDYELNPNNNFAKSEESITFDVAKVTSAPHIEIANNHIYENLTPNAHLNEARDNGKEVAGGVPNSEGAKITVGNIHDGETAAITFTFSATQSDGETPVDFTSADKYKALDADGNDNPDADVMRLELVDADGTVLATYPVSFIDGVWSTGPIEIEGGQGDTTLVFKPGYNHNSSDITIDYKITLTDNSSGDSISRESGDSETTPRLPVVVDAVAQAPEIENIGMDMDAITNNGGDGAFIPGETMSLQMNITYQDYQDGSERHFVLVQAKAGWDFPANKLTIVDSEGASHEIEVTWSTQKINGVQYYKAELSNDSIRDHGTSGTVDIRIQMESPDNVDPSVTFHAGGGSWEDSKGIDGEMTWDNNFSFVTIETSVSFSKAGGMSLKPDSVVYENDIAAANEGIYDREGGTTLTLTCKDGDAIENLTITYDDSRGVMEYKDANSEWQIIEPGTEIPGSFANGDQIRFTPAHDFSGEDVSFSYTATVKNGSSGDTNPIGDTEKPITSLIIADSVAQLPTDLQVPGEEVTASHEGGRASATFTVSANFQNENLEDETPYVLVEAKANMEVLGSVGTFSVKNESGGYTTYYKVPLYDNDGELRAGVTIDPIDGGGYTATVDVEISVTRLGNDNPGNIKVGALVEEITHDQEVTYHNNVAFADGGSVQIDYGNFGNGHLVRWEDAYENNNSNAHLGEGYGPDDGAKISFGSLDEAGEKPVTSVDMEWDPTQGYICVKNAEGDIIAQYESGSVTISGEDLDNLYFVPANNNRDDDAKITFTAHAANGEYVENAFTIIIDAVAQKPTDLEFSKVTYPDADDPSKTWKAMGDNDGKGNNGEALITISGKFADNDGSERHYALVEHQPGFVVEGAETVYLDGKSFYRVEMAYEEDAHGNHIYKTDADGKQYAEIKVVVVDPTVINSGSHTLQTGILAEEQNSGTLGNLELTLDNNVSWTLSEDGEGAVIEVAFVESSVSVTIGDTFENAEIEIIIHASRVGEDEFSGFTLSHTGEGSLRVVETDNVGGWSIDENGNLVITDVEAIENITVYFTPAEHDTKDVEWNWDATFTNPLSGDESVKTGSNYTIVDAVGNAPTIVETLFVSDEGTGAVLAGEGATVTVKLNFDDMSGREEHYAILQQGSSSPGEEWFCDKASVYDANNDTWVDVDVVTLYSEENGTPYYAAKIPADLHDDNGEASVQFHVTAPNYREERYDIPLSVGGVAVEPGKGTEALYRELTLDNNWGERLGSVVVNVGKFDTDEVKLVAEGTLTEGDTNGITLSFNGVAEGKYEALMEVEFTASQALPNGNASPAGTILGTIWYGESSFELVVGQDGKAVQVVDFGPDGYDPAVECRFVPADEEGNLNHNSQPIRIETVGSVWDSGLDVTETFNDINIFQIQAVADAPTGIAVDGLVEWDDSTSMLSFIVNAAFSDTDGSERHYILVEARESWELNTDVLTGSGGTLIKTITVESVNYFQIEVDSTLANPSIAIALKTPVGEHSESLKLAGFSEEVNASGTVTNTSSIHTGQSVAIDVLCVAGFVVASEFEAQVAEGMVANLTLHLCSPDGVSITSAEELLLVFTVTGATADAFQTGTVADANGNTVDWAWDANGLYTVTATLAPGSSELTITPQWSENMTPDGIIGNHMNMPVEFQLASVTPPLVGLESSLADQSGEPVSAFGFEVVDADTYMLQQFVSGIEDDAAGKTLVLVDENSNSFDGSGDALDRVVIGTDGDDAITAGPGNHILIGGEGADTFIFNYENLSSTDSSYSSTILDFNIQQGDMLDFANIFGGELDYNTLELSAGNTFTVKGNNGLSLSALFGEDAITMEIQNGEGTTFQSLNLHMTEGYTAPGDSTAEAQMMLETLIKGYTG